jgi:hypothetical protein
MVLYASFVTSSNEYDFKFAELLAYGRQWLNDLDRCRFPATGEPVIEDAVLATSR